jgi:hypothetical protein
MNYSKRILTFGITMLFLGTSAVPLTESISFSADPPVSVDLNGMLGDNGWFVSCVTITFVVNGEEVDYILFELDGGEWTVYTDSLIVSVDGEHTVCWYYVDTEGNHSEIECIDFKIDQIPPMINFTIERIGYGKYMAKADVSDETSGVNRIDLYFDGIFIVTLTKEPYEYEFSAICITHDINAIVFDNAGNKEVNPFHPIPSTRVFGIICNPTFAEDTVSFFIIAVVYRLESSFILRPFFFRQVTFYTVHSTYSGYIGEHFICAVLPYGPW